MRANFCQRPFFDQWRYRGICKQKYFVFIIFQNQNLQYKFWSSQYLRVNRFSLFAPTAKFAFICLNKTQENKVSRESLFANMPRKSLENILDITFHGFLLSRWGCGVCVMRRYMAGDNREQISCLQ